MGNNFYQQTRSLALVQQKISLDHCYHDSICKIYDHKELWWFGIVQPTPLSDSYQAVVIYKMNETPKVWVIGDNLRKLDANNFPHKFRISKERKCVKLCLFRRKYDDWTPSKLISKTIVPWTIEWLFYYELWCITEQWNGGGEHPITERGELELEQQIQAFSNECQH